MTEITCLKEKYIKCHCKTPCTQIYSSPRCRAEVLEAFFGEQQCPHGGGCWSNRAAAATSHLSWKTLEFSCTRKATETVSPCRIFGFAGSFRTCPEVFPFDWYFHLFPFDWSSQSGVRTISMLQVGISLLLLFDLMAAATFGTDEGAARAC